MTTVRELRIEARSMGIKYTGLRKVDLLAAIADAPTGGRPTKLTVTMFDLYVGARSRGGNDTDCAYIAGVHPHTVRLWRNRYDACDPRPNPDTGELEYLDDESHPTIPELFRFFEADKKATAEARLIRLNRIDKAGARGIWQADAWWLERKYPEDFGRRETNKVEMTATVTTHDTTGTVDPDEVTASGESKLDVLAVLAADIVAMNRKDDDDGDE